LTISVINRACVYLKVASEKCDGVTPPPDFIQGEAVSELHAMLAELMVELGCE